MQKSPQKNSVHTLIIGAGASGLFCAMQAAKKLPTKSKVLVIDHANKAGKKIVMSGGGKCNFTNYSVEPEHYLSDNQHFCKSALSRYLNWDFIALVEKHGVAYEERKHGQLFCLNSAKDILTMLLDECSSTGVAVQCDTTVNDIKKTASGFCVTTMKTAKKRATQDTEHNPHTQHEIHCDNLVIATGGLSIPSMGATGFGYNIAEQFGHTITPKQAGLVPFTFTDDIGVMTKTLSGNAIDVSTHVNSTDHMQCFNEAMLFTHRGLSGPAMLQISNYWHAGDSITLNLKADIDFEEWFILKKSEQPQSLIRTLLSPYFAKKIIGELQKRLWSTLAEKPLVDISNEKLQELGHTLNNWQIKPSGTEGYRKAEVTLGGVNVKDISSKTMQSTLQPNLYFIGEVLDVTGWLGGYNFQWAWASAYVCAESLVES